MLFSRCGTLKVLYAVFAYGDRGEHVVGGDMKASLLEEQGTDLDRRGSIVEMTDNFVGDGMESSLLDVDPRESFIEMGDRRASMDTFLTDARLSHLADKLQRDGIYGTQDLVEMEDDDLEAAGFRRAEKKRFLKAREKLREERANDGTEAEDVE